MNYDAYNQMQQNLAGWYSMQHPLVHTKLLGFFYWLGRHSFLGVNGAFALYSLLQMGAVSGCIACMLCYLYKKQASPWAWGTILLWACLWPGHALLAISTTKDVLFSALFLLLFILTLAWLEAADEWGIRRECAYAALLVLLMLFRKNGFHTVLFFWLGLAVAFFVRKNTAGRRRLKRMLLVTAAGLLLYQAASFALGFALHAAKGSRMEALSVPIQQLARTWTEHGGQIGEADQDLLTAFIPEETLADYDRYLSDPVKDNVNGAVLEENAGRYASLYIRLGLAFPDSYIKAFLDSTRGYWDPWDVSHARIYGWGQGNRQGGYLATDVKQIEGMDNVIHRTLLPAAERAYERVATDNVHQGWPVLSLLFAPAFYVWMAAAAAFLLAFRKRTALLPAMYLLLGYFITVLLGPCCLVRYAYPLILCAPAAFTISFTGENKT